MRPHPEDRLEAKTEEARIIAAHEIGDFAEWVTERLPDDDAREEFLARLEALMDLAIDATVNAAYLHIVQRLPEAMTKAIDLYERKRKEADDA